MEKNKELALIEDYLKKVGLTESLKTFKTENQITKPSKSTKLQKLASSEASLAKTYSGMKQDYQKLEKKQLSIAECNKQLYPIVKSCLSTLSKISDRKFNMDDLSDTIESYKIDLGKYTNIIKNDYWDEKIELFSVQSMASKKKRLVQANSAKNNEKIVELLLEFRVNALQIPPEQRREFIDQCIEIDLLEFSLGSPSFVLELFSYHAFNIRHAILSVLSIISSTLPGVDYILSTGYAVLERVIEIMRVQENGSVIQRFCVAILQKCSSREKVVSLYLKNGFVDWTVKLLNNSKLSEIHIFCLDFSTACLTNIFHSSKAVDFLDKNYASTRKMIECFLGMLGAEETATSVIMHILICLSYLTGSRFRKLREETLMVDKISSFSSKYANSRSGSDVAEKDKRTIIELCNQLYSDAKEDHSSMPDSTMSYDERIQEYEQEQGHIIFECFQDEIS